MRRVTLTILAAAMLLLAACSANRGGDAPTATLPAPTLTAALAAPAATQIPDAAPTTAPITAATNEPSPTAPAQPTATPDSVPASLGGDSLRTYRVMISMQINAALVSETAHQAAIQRLDPDEKPVAALAVAGLLQSVDEAVPGVSAPASLAGPWAQALEAHEQVRALTARWLLDMVSSAEAEAQFAPLLAELELAMLAADQALAEEYGVQAAYMSEYRLRIVAATARVYD